MRRLLSALLLVSGMASAQAVRLDTAAVRLDGYNPNALTGSGAAGRVPIWTGALTLSSDSALTFSGGSLSSTYVVGSSYVSTVAVLGSRAKTLTDATPTAFATVTIADGAMRSGEILYSVRSAKGTALQALTGKVRFAATREGAVYTVSIAEVGAQALAAAAGTLTGAIAISASAGVVTFTATFDTSQSSPDSMTVLYRFDSPDALVVTGL